MWAVRSRCPLICIHFHGSRAQKHVTFAGYLDGPHLARAYQKSTIFVLPTYWPEGFPNVIAEAMHFGLPIVTTQIRGQADHLKEGVHARFVPARDPARLAQILAELLNDAPLRAEMGRANREKVKDFAPEKIGYEYLKALQEIAV